MKNKGISGQCCGCYSCVTICPVDAIKMQPDEYGFFHASLNKVTCINCGKCEKVCPLISGTVHNRMIDAFAGYCVDDEMRKLSTSGAIFPAIARRVLEDDGVVYGVEGIFEGSHYVARHIRLSAVDELYRIQGSKYIQSSCPDMYPQIQKDVKMGKTVLASGTPCQIAALNNYLDCCYDNLITVDVVCHGISSQALFNDYVDNHMRSEHEKIIEYEFRTKKRDWGTNYSMKVDNGFGVERWIVSPGITSSFYQLYLNSVLVRDSCFSCPFASLDSRPADITLGDYWGVESSGLCISEQEVNKGVCCVLANTKKGFEILKGASALQLYKANVDHIASNNGQLNAPCVAPKERESYLDRYKSAGYGGVEDLYQSQNLRTLRIVKAKERIPYCIRKKIKVVAGHIMGK